MVLEKTKPNEPLDDDSDNAVEISDATFGWDVIQAAEDENNGEDNRRRSRRRRRKEKKEERRKGDGKTKNAYM